MGKNALCLIFAFLLSIESFAAVVSDNDGSAFITKAEFDSLKNNFQAQLDSFNNNIDSKIDNAIAGYLAGIKVEKTSSGENYISRLGGVRFYSQTKTLNTTSVDNIRYGYMVRAFGSLSPINVSQLYIAKARMGSWLYSSDGSHDRSGVLNYGGTENNYFYEVEDIVLGSTTYKALIDTTSKKLMHYFGAYGSCWDSNSDNNLVGNVTLKAYNLDLSSYSTNAVEPWEFSWSQLGMSMTAKGQKFNVWCKYDNDSDGIEGYYYFNNNWNDPNTNVNTFTTNDFNNWTESKQFDCSEWYGLDCWFSTHDDSTNGSNTTDYWTFRRIYTGNGGWHQGTTGYTNEGGIATSWINYTKATPWVKYKMPKFYEKKVGALVNGSATKLLKTDIYPYSGSPLTKMKDKVTKLEINLNVNAYRADTNVLQASKPYYVLIHRGKFPNNSTSYLLTLLPDDDYYMYYVDDGKSNPTITIDKDKLSKWNKDDYLYVRVYVEDTNCYAKVGCNDITFTTGDD